MHVLKTADCSARWLAGIAGALALALAVPASGHAEETNPNNYNCLGHLAAGSPEPGSEEHQVQYTFYCNGPITGYQLESQVPVTGVQSPPIVSDAKGTPLTDTFACSGEVPGFAVNCVGATKAGYETITGQFAIGSKLCAEPRVDPLLTVTYAYLEKGVVTQAISGPFDIGRPVGCHPDAFSGSTRFAPASPHRSHKRGKHRGHGKAKGHGKAHGKKR